VNHEVPVVEKHPLAVLDAFPSQRVLPRRLQLAFDLVDEAAQVRARSTGGDDKELGDNDEVGNVQDRGVFTLLLDDGRDRFSGGFDGLVVGGNACSSLIQLGSS
jgi:hypothetical protein